MKPIVIFGIAVSLAVIIILLTLIVLDGMFMSEDQRFVEDQFSELEEQNKQVIETYKEMCHGKYDGGKELESCLQEIEIMRQRLEEVVEAGRQDAKMLSP